MYLFIAGFSLLQLEWTTPNSLARWDVFPVWCPVALQCGFAKSYIWHVSVLWERNPTFYFAFVCSEQALQAANVAVVSWQGETWCQDIVRTSRHPHLHNQVSAASVDVRTGHALLQVMSRGASSNPMVTQQWRPVSEAAFNRLVPRGSLKAEDWLLLLCHLHNNYMTWELSGVCSFESLFYLL